MVFLRIVYDWVRSPSNLPMREGLQWKAHSHEARVARTWNEKPDPPAGGARPKSLDHG